MILHTLTQVRVVLRVRVECGCVSVSAELQICIWGRDMGGAGLLVCNL